ncbi:hypothetical protein SEA_ABBA_45 [Arthrobacter phage Abba]|uniref:Uncharacterized protein n=1 Tax=Arthrobacter phage Abba TaxID=2713256 RepID=A0A6G8R2F5_9CAUD|nr:hypothetical protein HYQ28_gp45 [Arthrobacter phage Abba]QIN94374.1 hypothetical protein SEA_ABBA_45 [Arthrobacter phage Abba]
MSNETRALANFAADVADHELTIKHDAGLYRHLLIKAPGAREFWHEIITSPGQLTVRGDMGAYVFARLDDMFDFFVDDSRAGNWINPGYWAEKLEAAAPDSPARVYSTAVAERVIREHATELRESWDYLADPLAYWAEIDELVNVAEQGEDRLRQAVEDFEHWGATFSDSHEWDFSDYSYRFIWNLHAIVRAIKSYRAVKRAQAPERADRVTLARNDGMTLAELRLEAAQRVSGGTR